MPRRFLVVLLTLRDASEVAVVLEQHAGLRPCLGPMPIKYCTWLLFKLKHQHLDSSDQRSYHPYAIASATNYHTMKYSSNPTSMDVLLLAKFCEPLD
eukprot:3354515-Amphidinium_carterae.1